MLKKPARRKRPENSRQENSRLEKWLCRSGTTLFRQNHIRFTMLVRDNTVVHDDSSRVVRKAFLKFLKILKNPQNSLKFYVWLFVRRVVLLRKWSVWSFVLIGARCQLFDRILIKYRWNQTERKKFGPRNSLIHYCQWLSFSWLRKQLSPNGWPVFQFYELLCPELSIWPTVAGKFKNSRMKVYPVRVSVGFGIK